MDIIPDSCRKGSRKLVKQHPPGAPRVYPRICPISIPADSGARSGFRVDIGQPRGLRELPAAGGVSFFCACPWLVSFVRACPAVAPGGPNPPGASAAGRLGRRARRGRCRLRSRAWCWSWYLPGAASGLLRSAPGAGGRKKRRRFLSAVCRFCRLSLPDPVVDISVLDHRIGPVACDDDMIEDEDADPVQQLLKLNR